MQNMLRTVVRKIYSSIGARSLRLRARLRGAHIDPTVQVLGWRSVRTGTNTVLSEGCWININRRSAREIQLDIGSSTYIGKRNFFSVGQSIRIGEYVLTTLDCKFICANHVYSNPFKPYIATGTDADSSIAIGHNCWFGAGATVLGNVCIGFGSVIGAGAIVRHNIPPLSVAAGNPAKVIKRYSISRNTWVSTNEFTAEDAADIPSEENYLAILKGSLPYFRLSTAAAGYVQGDLL